jgi:hypothetical protein
MSFCGKCRNFVSVTVAGACAACGLALGSPWVHAQSSGGAAPASISFVTPSHPLGNLGDGSDPPDPGEPMSTFDGPRWDFSSTAPTARYRTPPGSGATSYTWFN